jgi:hypothetical protein
MVAPGDAHRGAVAMHELAHLGRGKKDRGAAVVGHEETVTVGMAFAASRDHRDALCDQQRPGAVLHDLAGALERAQRAVEFAPRRAPDTQPRGKLVRGQRRARGIQRAKDAARVGSACVYYRRAVGSIAPSQRGSFGFFL